MGDEVFDQTADPYQRQRLGPILDAHLAAARDGIARHVAAQQEVYCRGAAAEMLSNGVDAAAWLGAPRHSAARRRDGVHRLVAA